MKNIKHIIAIVVALTAIILFTACSGGNTETSELLVVAEITPTPEPMPPPEPTIEPMPEPITVPAYNSWQDAFAAAFSENRAPSILLVDIDFDSIPEMFTEERGYGPNSYLQRGYRFNGNGYSEIVHDNGLLSELQLYRDKESNELIWLTHGFYRLNDYDSEWQWSTVNFKDLSSVTTDLFFGFIIYRTPIESDEMPDAVETEYALMEDKNDNGILMGYSEIERLKEDLFSKYERVITSDLWIDTNGLFVGYDNQGKVIFNTNRLIEFFSKWNE